MDNDYYLNFDLRLNDIWDYERSLFVFQKEKSLDDETMYHLLNLSESMILKSQPAFISIKAYDKACKEGDDNLKKYYERHEISINQSVNNLDKRVEFDAFSYKGDFYNRETDVVITPDKVNIEEYQFFLALKFRQYQKALTNLEDLLSFQRINSFKHIKYDFDDILIDTISQWEKVLSGRIKDKIERILSKNKTSSNDTRSHTNNSVTKDLYYQLNDFFFKENIEDFLKYEEIMVSQNFLKNDLQWLKQKHLVVSLFYILDREYQWMKKSTKRNIISLASQGRFFKQRYQTGNLSNIFKIKFIVKYSDKIHLADFRLINEEYKVKYSQSK